MEGAVNQETVALVTLLRSPDAKWPEIAYEVAAGGSASAVLEQRGGSSDGLFADPRASQAWADAVRDVRRWTRESFRVVTVLDPDYPARLLEIHEMPPLLFVRGRLRADEPAVSVVGSRQSTDRGVSFARALSRGLVERGVAVISGLATGIDTAAHAETLAVGGRPLGVIGTGIRRTYPAQNADLQEQVASQGAVGSQCWPDAPPTKKSFPMRNAVMSGMGAASIIVEAGEHSGTRIQARVAVEHGRPVILTDSVFSSTSWAAALSSRPGVYRAGSVQEALDIVDDLLAPEPEVNTRDVRELLAL
jgi:DNA processing protein